MEAEKTKKIRIGEKTYVISSDDTYLEQIGTEFEPQMVALFKSLISKEGRVIDVGANVGCTTILFGELAGQVDSFEPSPTTFAFLARNVERAGLENVTLHNLALGE